MISGRDRVGVKIELQGVKTGVSRYERHLFLQIEPFGIVDARNEDAGEPCVTRHFPSIDIACAQSFGVDARSFKGRGQKLNGILVPDDFDAVCVALRQLRLGIYKSLRKQRGRKRSDIALPAFLIESAVDNTHQIGVYLPNNVGVPKPSAAIWSLGKTPKE